MKASLQLKGIIVAAISSFAALALAVAAGRVFQPAPAGPAATAAGGVSAIPPAGTPARRGHDLFLLNCAHCHGPDARGDEGPDLHGLAKSDARIASMIKNGIKGEMPKFGAKLTDPDVEALIAFIRTLKD